MFSPFVEGDISSNVASKLVVMVQDKWRDIRDMKT